MKNYKTQETKKSKLRKTLILQNKKIEGTWGGNPVPTFNWFFEYHPIWLEILTQKGRNQFASRRKRSSPKELGSGLGYTAILNTCTFICHLHCQIIS